MAYPNGQVVAMEHHKIVLIGALLMASVFLTDACKGTPDSDCAKAVPEKMEVKQCEGPSVCHYTDIRAGGRHKKRFKGMHKVWS
ncbi:uncharacterized protein LOC116175191 isoform X2 [Photinus pyralis]|uniref:uncharacterized protein LOC116175191 isoform X2 n=1 Tax=Photinus pyralis TaxID=7054 RepID=UPI00126743CB|nr:uncharacterized protein LOC116175191 isoform X2 [Photinus pyralis]